MCNNKQSSVWLRWVLILVTYAVHQHNVYEKFCFSFDSLVIYLFLLFILLRFSSLWLNMESYDTNRMIYGTTCKQVKLFEIFLCITVTNSPFGLGLIIRIRLIDNAQFETLISYVIIDQVSCKLAPNFELSGDFQQQNFCVKSSLRNSIENQNSKNWVIAPKRICHNKHPKSQMASGQRFSC